MSLGNDMLPTIARSTWVRQKQLRGQKQCRWKLFP